MTTLWNNLPNARYIDWVLSSLEKYPEKWVAVRDISGPESLYSKQWAEAAKVMPWKTRKEIESAVQEVARNIAMSVATEGTWRAAWNAAIEACVAFIIWDDCSYMLESDVGELKILASLGDPRALFLFPACIIFNETKELYETHTWECRNPKE